MNHQYRIKDNTIEAFQMTPERRMDNSEWPAWLHEAWNKPRYKRGALIRDDVDAQLPDKLAIHRYGVNRFIIEWGDWIVRASDGSLTVLDDEEFREKYERILDDKELSEKCKAMMNKLATPEGRRQAIAEMEDYHEGMLGSLKERTEPTADYRIGDIVKFVYNVGYSNDHGSVSCYGAEGTVISIVGNTLCVVALNGDSHTVAIDDPTLRLVQRIKVTSSPDNEVAQLRAEVDRLRAEVEKYRNKWLEARRYLRQANKGAERASMVHRLLAQEIRRLRETETVVDIGEIERARERMMFANKCTTRTGNLDDLVSRVTEDIINEFRNNGFDMPSFAFSVIAPYVKKAIVASQPPINPPDISEFLPKPDNCDHCFHPSGKMLMTYPAAPIMVCCHCGKEHWEEAGSVTPPGHGPYAPPEMIGVVGVTDTPNAESNKQ